MAALNVYILPFEAKPMTFSCTLSGVELRFTNKWNEQAQLWFVDIEKASDGTKLVAGLPLVTGCDLLAPFRHLGLQGHIFCHTDGDNNQPPTYSNLGTDCKVYFTPESVPAFEGF